MDLFSVASTWMSGSILSTGWELSSCGYCWDNLNIEHKQSSCCNMKENVNIVSKDLNVSSVGEKDSGKIPNVELNAEESMKNQNCPKQLSVVSTSSDQDCHDISQKFIESLSLGAKSQKCLSKCKTFLVSRDVQEHSLVTNIGVDSLGGNDQYSSPSGIYTYSRSISLSSSSALVSAMKGGRALNGGMIKPELRVKWAPDVYDPPSTSMSHTVNGHHQRSKAKKRDKLKSKGKSARRNGGEKKNGNRKSFNKAPVPLNVRLQGNGRAGFDKPEVSDIFEYGINAQEVKCGSSFLMEALPKVLFPMGEAS